MQQLSAFSNLDLEVEETERQGLKKVDKIMKL
jgi:hypothetical protein